MSRDGFHGWPPTAIAFYEGLEADNSKSYWLEHKELYDQDVKAPMLALLAEMEDEFGEAHLFRPYRDTRFSADKTPYKTVIAATIGYRYVGLSAEGLRAGAGIHQMAADQLDRYRAAVAADRSGRRLDAIARELRSSGVDVDGVDALKSAPRGYPKDHPRIEYLRYKGIVTTKSWPVAAWLGTAGARKRVERLFRTSEPLVQWLAGHVGPAARSEAPGAR